jgi:hypothetical protein
LYWFTDLQKAKETAAREGKPILSLRLLGNLSDDLSCANSRFFRTVLYSNESVSRLLRETFILHWQSVRPVPVIRIDFGDGRKLERTITGNSIHYVLDQQGRTVDALPGLYGPAAFQRLLDRAATAASHASSLEKAQFDRWLREHHTTQLDRMQAEWKSDVRAAGLEPWEFPGRIANAAKPAGADAIDATRLAFSKSRIEINPVTQVIPGPIRVEDSNDPRWSRLVELRREDARLDGSSIHLIRVKQLGAAAANRITASKRIVEDPMVAMLESLHRSIGEDTVRNEYTLHARIHQWFANGEGAGSLDALNEKVYAQLFLMPKEDAWLGLAPADAFSAIDNGGLVQGGGDL